MTQVSVQYRDIPNNQVLFYFGLFRFDNETNDCDSLRDCETFILSVKNETSLIQYDYNSARCFSSSQTPSWSVHGCAIVSFHFGKIRNLEPNFKNLKFI